MSHVIAPTGSTRASGGPRVRYRRLPIELESPEELGYDTIRFNLSESSVADRRLADLGIDAEVSELLLQYGDHRGLPELRAAIAADAEGLGAEHVIVTPGAAAALFLIHSALLGAGDHALVVRPNYATNVETPRALGADVEYLDLRFEDDWRLDLDRVQASLRPETVLVSVCVPGNPSGQTLSEAELRALVALVERHPRAVLLVDETYRELAYGVALPLAASLSDRVLGVSSISKAYGLPGLRIGWITCRDEARAELLLAAKEQVLLCGSTIDETLAARVLEGRHAILAPIREGIERHRNIVVGFFASQPVFEWVEPQAGVVCFPRIAEQAGVDVERFHHSLLADHGTYVGGGHWFERDRRYFRVGFAWPTTDELRAGLAALAACARSSVYR